MNFERWKRAYGFVQAPEHVDPCPECHVRWQYLCANCLCCWGCCHKGLREVTAETLMHDGRCCECGADELLNAYDLCPRCFAARFVSGQTPK